METHTDPQPRPFSPAVVRDVIKSFVPTRASEAESIVRELFTLAGIEIGGASPGDIRVHDPRFYERVLRDASIGFGESYMDGWWETDALDVTIEKIMRANLKQKITGSWRLRTLTVKAAAPEPPGQGALAARRSRRTTTSATTSTRGCSTSAWSTPAPTGRTPRRCSEAQDAKLDLVVPEGRPRSRACACSTSAAAGAASRAAPPRSTAAPSSA